MRRNASGQKVQAMMRTSAAAITSVVALATRTTSGATNATPIVVTTTVAHGMIPGNRVEISGITGNTAANGTFVVIAVGSTTTFSLGNSTTGAAVAGNGTYGGTGAVIPQSVNVYVSKDGGAPTTGAGTLSHIGRGAFNAADTPDSNQTRSVAATVAGTVSVVGNTTLTIANGGINATTLGLWSYTPTASETNASAVSFTFTSPGVGSISVTQNFEPTSGPIVLNTTIATLSSQTSFTLTAGAPDDNTYNGYLCVVYDATTEAQVAIGVVSAYTASTKTITLLAAPLNTAFTMAAGDFATLIADPGLKPLVANTNASVDVNGRMDVIKIAGTTQTARDLGASVLLSSGTGTGQVSLTSGAVTLAATGLDAITVANPSGVADTFPKMVVQTWRRFFKKTTKTATDIKTYADNGSTVVTTQTVSDDGTTQTQGVSS